MKRETKFVFYAIVAGTVLSLATGCTMEVSSRPTSDVRQANETETRLSEAGRQSWEVRLIGTDKTVVSKDRAFKAIGQVESRRPNETKILGSCVLVDDDHVLSCQHIVCCPKELVVTLGEERIKASLVVVDTYHDWSILKLERASAIKPLPVENRPIIEGKTLFGFGYGGGYGYTRLVPKGGVLKGLLTEGDSGGPIMTSDGKVVGVCTEKVTDLGISRGWGIGKLKNFVDRWVDSGEQLRVVVTE